MIQVKKKPGPVSAQASNSPKVSPPPSASKKRKRVAVISDSSEDDDEEIIEEDLGVSSTKKSEEKKEDSSKSTKMKESKLKKPDLISNRAHLECSPKRPCGRPPMTRDSYNDLNNTTPSVVKPSTQKSTTEISSNANKNESAQPSMTSGSTIFKTSYKLPAMKMDKSRVYNFNMLDNDRVTIQVNNNLVVSKLHEIKCISEKYNWSALASSFVITVGASKQIILVVCKNGSLHMFNPSGRGQRLIPPLQLPSPVSKMSLYNGQLALVTTCAHLYIWDLEPRPKIKMRKEDIQSLLATNNSEQVTIAKLITSPNIMIITSVGRSFTYDNLLGTWLCLTDTTSSIQACSNYATAAANLPLATKDMPLASLGYLTPVQPPRLQSSVPQETMSLANITHCRNQRLSAEYLKSPKEYEYWLMLEIRHMAAEADVDGLRSLFDWLMGPAHSNSRKKAKNDTILETLNKHELLKSGLFVIKSNLHLQRLYTEYEDQLNSVEEVSDIDKMLDI